jgi:hypothetical protein
MFSQQLAPLSCTELDVLLGFGFGVAGWSFGLLLT